MRILLVHDYASEAGGAERVVRSLRDGMRRLGHAVEVLTSSAAPPDQEHFADHECRGTLGRWRTLLQVANPSAHRTLRRVLREFRPDVVHVRMFLTQLSPLILPLLRDVPSLYHVAWQRPFCPVGTKVLPDGTACQEPFGRACLRQGCLPWYDFGPLMVQMRLWQRWRSAFNAIVANSRAMAGELVAAGFPVHAVIANGVPVQPEPVPLGSPPVVAFAGRLVAEKGVDVLLQAFAALQPRVPEAQLWIAGAGPQRAALEGWARERQISGVEFLGHLSGPDLEQRFGRAWVQVVPSRWREPFGRAAVEAMMRGTAVVVSDTGGLREIVDDPQVGVRVPPGNAAALAEALAALLQDPRRARQLGAGGRARARRDYAEDAICGQFVALYEQLLQGN